MLKNLGLVSANGLLMFAKIIEVAAHHGQDLQTVAMRYALERFLARVFAADAPKVLAVDGTAAAILSSDTVTLKAGSRCSSPRGSIPLTDAPPPTPTSM